MLHILLCDSAVHLNDPTFLHRDSFVCVVAVALDVFAPRHNVLECSIGIPNMEAEYGRGEYFHSHLSFFRYL